jgi:hypothetical protein
VVDEPHVRRLVECHLRSFERHQGRRPGPLNRIADAVEQPEIGTKLLDFPDRVGVKDAIGRCSLPAFLLRSLTKEIEPFADRLVLALIPEMQLLFRRNVNVGVAL